MKITPSATNAALLLAWTAILGPRPSLASEAAAAPASSEHAARRARVLEEMGKAAGEKAVLLLRAPPPDQFANDVHYPYRPDNDLYYLSGIAQEGTALLLSTREIEGVGREALFLPRGTPGEGLWITRRLTPGQAGALSGLPERAILSVEKLEETLRKALGAPGGHHDGEESRTRLFFDPRGRSRPGEPLPEGYGFLLSKLGSRAFHLDLASPGRIIHPLRQVKTPGELALLRKAIDITCQAQREAMRAARPGVFEYELASTIEHGFRARGAAGWAFPSIVGSGPNSCILHYDRYDRRVAEGDLVLMDIGAECGWYAADVTRTVPAGGRFSERQRRVYQIVLDAQEAAFKAIRPGVAFGDVHKASQEVVAEGLLGLGLIKEKSEAGKYFPHQTSHGLGLDVHDPMPLRTLAAGMVITVEPGIYIPEESLGVRIEDDVLVTESGCEVLSTGAPRSIEDVERCMAAEPF